MQLVSGFLGIWWGLFPSHKGWHGGVSTPQLRTAGVGCVGFGWGATIMKPCQYFSVLRNTNFCVGRCTMQHTCVRKGGGAKNVLFAIFFWGDVIFAKGLHLKINFVLRFFFLFCGNTTPCSRNSAFLQTIDICTVGRCLQCSGQSRFDLPLGGGLQRWWQDVFNLYHI